MSVNNDKGAKTESNPVTPEENPHSSPARVLAPNVLEAKAAHYERWLDQQVHEGSRVIQEQAGQRKKDLQQQCEEQERAFCMKVDIEVRQQQMALEQEGMAELAILQQRMSAQKLNLEMGFNARVTETQTKMLQLKVDMQQAELLEKDTQMMRDLDEQLDSRCKELGLSDTGFTLVRHGSDRMHGNFRGRVGASGAQ